MSCNCRPPPPKKHCDKQYKTTCKPLKCVCIPTFDEQLKVYGRVVAQKILNSIPLSVNDFPPGGIQSLTPEQKEIFRSAETEGMACCLGKHKGWKLALVGATPQTPILGYTAPAFGELLKKMILTDDNATVPSNAGLTVNIKGDLLFLVKDEGINYATTPQQVLLHLEGVYLATEYGVVGTNSIIEATGPAAPTVPGQLNGQGLLQVTNVAARLYIKSTKLIRFHDSSRSLADWELVLNGGLIANDDLTLSNNTHVIGSVPPPNVPHLTNLLNLINLVNQSGNKIKKCDLLSPGIVIGLRILNPLNPPTHYKYISSNLDPDEPTEMNLTFSSEGKCFGC